jgi:RimJ/RimL family protein N-acetyltransferase
MTFERTSDLALVKSILTAPACWRRMTDDAAPAPENFRPQIRDRLVYVVARHHSKVVGLFVLVTNLAMAEVHFCIVPEAWGRERTVRIGREFIAWAWAETSLDWLVAPCPEHNRLALKLAEECGFTRFAEERGCVTKNGGKYSRIVLQIKRPNYETV